MENNFPEFDAKTEPRLALARFIAALRTFLWAILKEGHDVNGQALFWREFSNDLPLALDEANQHFDATINYLLSERRSEYKKREHGLYGSQLHLKLWLVRFYHERYVRMGRSVLAKTLGVIDDLVDSLHWVPGCEAVTEIKKVIENCIAD